MIRVKENVKTERETSVMENQNTLEENSTIDVEEKVEETYVTNADATEAAGTAAEASMTKEAKMLETEETKEETKEEIKELDSLLLQHSKSHSVSRGAALPGAVTLVSSDQNGNRRIVFASQVMVNLKNPAKVQIAYTKNSIVIAENIPGGENYFKINVSGKKGIIYSVQLANEIIKKFELDFKGITSRTFYEVKYSKVGEYPAAIIKITE